MLHGFCATPGDAAPDPNKRRAEKLGKTDGNTRAADGNDRVEERAKLAVRTLQLTSDGLRIGDGEYRMRLKA